jgi:hypothetical protein
MQISGPVSLRVFRDTKSDRYFYVFGDVHYSLEGSCSQVDKSLKCNRPSFDFQSSVKTGTDCWTVSALIDDVLQRHGDQKIRTDFYIELSTCDPDYVSPILTEYFLRQSMGPPRSARDAENVKERLKEEGYDWITDIYSTVYRKPYGDSVRVRTADARRYNDVTITPFVDPASSHKLMEKLYATIENYAKSGDDVEYRFSMNEHFNSIQELLILSDQLVADPYEFFEHLFVPKDYVEETKLRIEYIPSTSEETKKIVKGLYKSIHKRYGFQRRDGVVVSHSAASWAKLKNKNKELAEEIDEFTRQFLKKKSLGYLERAQALSSIMEGIDFTEPSEVDLVIGILRTLEEVFVYGVVVGSIIMDRYVISETLQSDAKHNFYYAGNAHARNYAKFFKHHGFELIEEIPMQSPNHRCVASQVMKDLLF